MDVFLAEPVRGESSVRAAGLPNVILTRVGGSTEDAQQDIGEFVAGKLIGYLVTGALEATSAMARYMELWKLATLVERRPHREELPCAIAEINQLLAEHDANIEGQLLGTRDELGYVLTDIGTEYTAGMLARLQAMDVTIRLRTVDV